MTHVHMYVPYAAPSQFDPFTTLESKLQKPIVFGRCQPFPQPEPQVCRHLIVAEEATFIDLAADLDDDEAITGVEEIL